MSDVQPSGDFLAADERERRRWLMPLRPEERAELVATLPDEALVSRGREAVRALGIYEAVVTKQERVGGALLPVQKIKVIARPEPFALRLEFLDGPGRGRKAFYSRAIDAERVRVREAGLLGFAGALWIDVTSPLARRDTNHVISEVGLGPLVEMVARDFEAVKGAGGHRRTVEGLGEGGLVWFSFEAPAGARGLFGARTRLGVEALSGTMLAAEAFNPRGELLERVRYQVVRDRLPLPDLSFRPEAMGL